MGLLLFNATRHWQGNLSITLHLHYRILSMDIIFSWRVQTLYSNVLDATLIQALPCVFSNSVGQKMGKIWGKIAPKSPKMPGRTGGIGKLGNMTTHKKLS